MQNPQLLVEAIIRTRIYECTYWKEECFALNAEHLIDRAVKLDHIGGVSGNINPTDFLCLVMKLINLQPDTETVLHLITQPHFKYLRALGAFYYRLTAKSANVYRTLEPLLEDRRKLRSRKPAEFVLTYMDAFIDALLTEERCLDIILPRMTQRFVLEENGELDARISPLQDELDRVDATMEDAVMEEAEAEPVADVEPLLTCAINDTVVVKRVSEKKISKLFKKIANVGDQVASRPTKKQEKRNDNGDMSIEETNIMRASLGLKPLK